MYIRTGRALAVGVSASEEKKYNNIDGLLEVNYRKDTQMLSFVIDEESKTIEYIYIEY